MNRGVGMNHGGTVRNRGTLCGKRGRSVGESQAIVGESRVDRRRSMERREDAMVFVKDPWESRGGSRGDRRGSVGLRPRQAR